MGAEEILTDGNGVVRMSDHRKLRASWWRAMKAGLLIHALPGIALDRGLEDDMSAWIRAVSLWNPNAIFAGRAAAALSFHPEAELKTLDIHVKGRLPDRGPIRFRRDTIDRELLVWETGFRITDPTATAVTAGLVGDLDTATTALRMNRTTPERIRRHAAAWTRRRAAQALEVAEALSGNPWSVAEVDAHELFRAAGVRGWHGNREIWVGDQKLVPDIGFHDAKIAFEINSFEFHSAREAMEHDASRQNQFQSVGWRSYTLTPRQIRDHRAETIEFVRSVVRKRHSRYSLRG